MRGSIFKLLCIIFLTVVIMSEPPEKKFKTEAVAKAQRIFRNSAVVPTPPIVVETSAEGQYRTASGVLYKRTATGQWRKQSSSSAGPSPPIVAPVIIVTPIVADSSTPVVASDFEEFPPVILADSASVGLSARAGYYQTANGQWRKRPTPRSTVAAASAIVSPAPRTSAARIPVAVSPASNSSIAGGATSAIISPALVASAAQIYKCIC